MAESVFNGIETNYEVTEKVKKAFDENGYIIMKGVLPPDELECVKKAVEAENGVRAGAYKVDDGEGRFSKITVWNSPGNDVTGLLARSDKIAGVAEKLLGDEVYHYHSKLLMKEPRTGGKWAWHQDYGYWYNNGCLLPDMMTINIAIDKSHKVNGCLQVLKCSHKAGRVDHGLTGQLSIDEERIENMKKKFELLHAELDQGDALFFHSNLLHCSAPNTSEFRRWMLAICFNTKNNNPYKAHHHPFYTPLERVPNSAILKCQNPMDMAGKDFMDPNSPTLASQNVTVELSKHER